MVSRDVGASKVAQHLDHDLPQHSVLSDESNRLGLVRSVASLIKGLSAAEPLVISVQGPWGVGKTSFLNFLQEELKEDRKQILVMRFDPWWFSSADDLVVRFFHELQGALGRADNKTVQNGAKVVGHLANLVRPVGLFVPGLTEIATSATRSAETVAKAAQEAESDIFGLRQQIEQLLRTANVSVLVLVDDVDRLTHEEIRNVFRMVKGVSALRGLIYLIAYDFHVVAHALEPLGGARYLEKIVQSSVELALPTQRQLQSALQHALNQVVGDNLFTSRWYTVYNELLASRLSTFRDVKRLVNACLMTYPAVREEVDPIDFVALEAVRLHWPVLYQLLAIYCHLSEREGFQPGSSVKSPKDFVKDSLASSPDSEVLTKMAEALFASTSAGFLGLSRNLQTYFRLAPEPGVVTNKQWNQIRSELAYGSVDLRDLLISAPDRRYLESVLERLETLVRDRGLSSNLGSNIFEGVIAAGDSILNAVNSAAKTLFSLPLEWAINRVLFLSLRQIPAVSRPKAMKNLVLTQGGPLVSARFLLTLEDSEYFNNMYGGAELAELQAFLPTLRRNVVKQLKLAARNSQLWSSGRHLPFLIAIWQEWDRPGAAAFWVRSQVRSSPQKLAELIGYAFGTPLRQGYQEYCATEVREFGMKHLEGLLKQGGWSAAGLQKKIDGALKSQNLSAMAVQDLQRVRSVIKGDFEPEIGQWHR